MSTWSRQLLREQVAQPDEHAGKLFGDFTIKDEPAVDLDALQEEIYMTAGGQQTISEHPPTILIVYLRPEQDEVARYHIDEELTTSGIPSRLIAQHLERVPLESTAPFVLTYSEKRLVYALLAPPDPAVINDIAQLVTTGLILGFAIKGEIALGGEVGVFNNLA